jgi:hypothetical protein
MLRALALARVAQPTATTAREDADAEVQLRYPPPAALAIASIFGAQEPRTDAAEVALGPHNRYALLKGLPLLFLRAAPAKGRTTASLVVTTSMLPAGSPRQDHEQGNDRPYRKRPWRYRRRTSWGCTCAEPDLAVFVHRRRLH